jgi:hypothetical protein
MGAVTCNCSRKDNVFAEKISFMVEAEEPNLNKENVDKKW